MTGFDPETFVNCATTIAKPMVVKIVLFSFNYSFKKHILKNYLNLNVDFLINFYKNFLD